VRVVVEVGTAGGTAQHGICTRGRTLIRYMRYIRYGVDFINDINDLRMYRIAGTI
jgi:hypothetical protein